MATTINDSKNNDEDGDDESGALLTASDRAKRFSDAEVSALSDGHTHCLVCYSDLTYRGKTPCQHDDICGVCHLRLRFLHGERNCPICKSENDSIVVDTDPTKTFDDYPRWGDDIGAGFVRRDDVGMFFQSDYYDKEILPLFAYSCHVCDFPNGEDVDNNDNENENEQQQQQQNKKKGGKKKQSQKQALQEHLRVKHRLALCQLCVDNKRDFVARLPRMNPRQLQTHFRNGDGPSSGFFGHPVCEFCKPKRFYDLATLHQHLHKEHYKCHVCEKQGLDNQFFKNYKSLERHFDQQHFMCHDVQCLAARFVVFDNELDLRAHELSVHGGTSTGSTKINLEFRTRRPGYDGSGLEEQQDVPSESDFNYGLDGQAFVPQALPNQGGSNSQLHPLHLQRTQQLREQAAEIRQQQALESQSEAFPTLQSAAANTASSAPLVGWASGETRQRLASHKKQAGKVTQEDYPSLPTSSAASSSNKMKNVRNINLGTTRRQFAAMSTAAAPTSRASHSSFSNAAAATGLPSSSHTLRGTNYAAPRMVGNRQADLTPGNFPALGPSAASSRAQYTAANALGKKNMQKQQGWNNSANNNAPAIHSVSDFPSMPGSSGSAQQKQQRSPKKQSAATTKKAPSISSTQDFPPPPSSATTYQTVRNNVMGNNNTHNHQANSNVLQANLASTSASAKASIEEMKATLGPNRFKELKRLTKEFSGNQLSSEGYVDQSAALFEKGYADPDFWSFLPSLLESTPNQDASDRALIYMTSIKRQQFDSKPAASQKNKNASPPISSWGNSAGRVAAAAAPAGRPNVVAGKKKNSWGGGGTTTVVRAKAAPGSVGGAAASQGPQGGSATKFMAKQQKKQQNNNNNQNNSGNNNKSKNKKKERDELRALAFGGK